VNIRGARANRANLLQYLDDLNYPEIVILNETKLGYLTRFDLDGYNCASRREPNPTGGSRGSMILVRSDVDDVTEIDELKTKFRNDEVIGVEIKKSPTRPGLKVFTNYIPPDHHPNPDIFSFISQQQGKCVVSGDFNCKNLSWGSSKTEPTGEELQNIIHQNNLFVLNDGSNTRYDPRNGKEEVLDLILCNFETLSIFQDFWVGDEIGSDHYPLQAKLQFKEKPSMEPPEKERRFEKTNWKKFEKILVSYGALTVPKSAEDVDKSVQVITDQITDAFNSCCPLQKKRPPARKAFTQEIRSKIKEKRKLRREKGKAKERNDFPLLQQIQSQSNRLGNEIKKLQKMEKRRKLGNTANCLIKKKTQNCFFKPSKSCLNQL
jgi:hypothetical protein